MNKTTVLVAGLALALSAGARAEYDWEVGASVGGGDVDSVGLRGAYFFEPVDDSKGPLAESAFLDMASFVELAVDDSEIDRGNDIETASEDYAIGTRYIAGENNWIVDLGYRRSEDETLGFENETDAFAFGIGKYLTATTTMVLSYENQEDDNADIDVYGIELAHFMAMGEHGLKLQAGYDFIDIDGDDLDRFNVDGTWYPCKRLGIGGGWSYTEGDDNEVDEYRVSASYFISERVQVSLSYNEIDADDQGLEADYMLLGLLSRW